MQSIAMAFPVLPGKSKQARELAKAVKAKHAKDFALSEKKSKVTKEFWFLQTSSQGDMIIDYLEAANPAKGFATFAKSKDKFDVWLKAQIKDISGIDMNKPSDDPLPEVLLSFPF